MLRRFWFLHIVICSAVLWAQSVERVGSETTTIDVTTVSDEIGIGSIDITELNDEAPVGEPRSVYHRMNVQGYLTDNNGNPINGNVPMTFSIWDAFTSGSRLWGYEYDTVYCSNGRFNYLIGGKTAITPIVFSSVTGGGSYRALQITIYSTTMPRITIGSVGSAYMAGKSDSSAWAYNSDKLDGYHGGTTGTNIYTRTEATGKLNTGVIPAITSSMIQDGTVANADLANNSVNSAKIQDGTVGNGDLANNSVNSAKIQDGTVGNGDLANNAVNSAKIQDGSIQPVDMGFSAGDITGVWGGTGLNGGASSGEATLHIDVPLVLSSSQYDASIIYGLNPGTGTTLNAYAVRGSASGDAGGVYGSSNEYRGVVGRTNVSYSYGVYCYGNFGATGTKSAVVNTSKGPTSFYCQESPEVWFEDFGSANLRNGECQVMLDPIFIEATTIDQENPMKVFIQLNGECNGVYVVKSADRFTVIEQHSGNSGVSFDYRVVAKRKEYENQRLETVKDEDKKERQ